MNTNDIKNKQNSNEDIKEDTKEVSKELSKSEKISWRFQTGGAIFSSPVILEDVIYFGSNDGNLYAVKFD